MEKKSTAKKEEKKVRHPLGEKLATIQAQIEKSDKFQNPIEFINGLNEFVMNQEVPKIQNMTFGELIRSYVDHIEMFVTEKDRIVELLLAKLILEDKAAKVNAIRESDGGRFTVQVTKNKKNETMYVQRKKGKDKGYTYGVRNYEIGSL